VFLNLLGPFSWCRTQKKTSETFVNMQILVSFEAPLEGSPSIPATRIRLMTNVLHTHESRFMCGSMDQLERKTGRDSRVARLQVESMWENKHTQERLLSGPRLFPLVNSPWQLFAPPGIPRKRCLVLSQEMHTVAVDRVTCRERVRFQRASLEEEVELRADLAADAASMLCHLQTTPGGGVDNIAP
jgi:hypothetical protein